MFLSQRTNLLFAIAFFGTKRFKEEDIKNDKNGNLLLLDVKIDDQNFILLNIYNANIEKEQLSALTELKTILNNVNNISSKQISLGGDLNFYFELLLETKGENSVFKKISCDDDWDQRNLWSLQGTIIWTGITGSLQVKILKYFKVMWNIFEISHVKEIEE